MALSVSNDERYERLKADGERFATERQVPFQPCVLKIQVARFAKYTIDLHMVLIQAPRGIRHRLRLIIPIERYPTKTCSRSGNIQRFTAPQKNWGCVDEPKNTHC